MFNGLTYLNNAPSVLHDFARKARRGGKAPYLPMQRALEGA